MQNPHHHPPLSVLTELFAPEIRGVLTNKLTEQLSIILSQKQTTRRAATDNTLRFQRAWLKSLQEEYEHQEVHNQQTYLEACRVIAKNKQCDQELSRFCVRFLLEQRLKTILAGITAAKKLLAILRSQQPNYHKAPDAIDQNDIEVARSISLSDYLGKNAKHLISCPFHTERTPSFKIFPDNRFKCFGCGAAGDIIDYIRKVQALTFKEAVRFLLNYR